MSWIDQFLTAIGQVQDAGAPLIQRPTINFLGAGVTAADDPTTKVTTVTISGGGGGGATQVNAEVVATSSLTLSGSQTIDGVVASPGAVVLAAGQSSAPENGLWVVASGAWSRTTDTLVPGLTVYIQQGTSGKGTTYQLVTQAPIVPGTTPLLFLRPGSSVDPGWFGALADGTTDDHAAINAAAAAAALIGGVLSMPAGRTYAIAAQVAINCHVEAKGATLTTSGALNSGACVAVLVGTSGTNLNGKLMHLPNVIDSTFASPGAWSGSKRVGVECRNLYNCDVHLGLIYGFSIGAYVTGDNNPDGNQIGRYWINSLIDNQVNLQLEGISQGWVNENVFYAGDFQITGIDTTIAAGSDTANLPQGTIHVASTTAFPASGNLYVVTDAGPQLVAYTGTSGGNAFTGCTGGTGEMHTGNAVIVAFSGTRHIKLINGGGPGGTGGGCNSNMFIKPCLEGDFPEYHVEFVGASYNELLNARWETNIVPPKVHLDSSSFSVERCGARGGYAAEAIVASGDASQFYIVGQQQILFSGGGTPGAMVLTNVIGNSDQTFAIMGSYVNGWMSQDVVGAPHAPANPATDYFVAIAADWAKFKIDTDTQPRVFVDTTNDSIWFGLGGSSACNSRVGINPANAIAGGALEVYGTAGTVLGKGVYGGAGVWVDLGAHDVGSGNSQTFFIAADNANVLGMRASGAGTLAEIFTPPSVGLEIASSADLDLFSVGAITLQSLTAAQTITIGATTTKTVLATPATTTASSLVALDGSQIATSFAPTQPGESIVAVGSSWLRVGPTNGGTLPNSDTSVGIAAGHFFVLPAATLSANHTLTLDTTSATTGARITILRLDATANTYAIVNGGVGGGTLYTFPVSVIQRATFLYNAAGAWVLEAWEGINAA